MVRLLHREGNKINEFKRNKDNIYKFLDENQQIKNIVEPFAGSMASMFLIYKKYGNKYNYYGFENDINFYNYIILIKKSKNIKKIISDVKKIIDNYNIDLSPEKKEDIKNMVKKNETITEQILRNTYYTLRFGLIPDKKKSTVGYEFNKVEDDINFIKKLDIYLNGDFLSNISKFDKNNTLFILDPPYINSENSIYKGMKNINKEITDNTYYYYQIKYAIMKEEDYNYMFFINSTVLLDDYYNDVKKYSIKYKKIYQKTKKNEFNILYSSFQI